MAYNLLVVEDKETPPHSSIRTALGDDSTFKLEPVSWGEILSKAPARKDPHALVLVAVPGTPQVLRVLESMRDDRIAAPTLAVLPADPPEQLLRLSTGASDDFLLSPVRPVELRQRLGRVLRVTDLNMDELRERLFGELGMTQLIGRDANFWAALRDLPRFARCEAPLLITGETGTGKELCARAVHLLSRRRDQPFLAVDCAALPDHLVENELFGHSRGAYTDAHRDQCGLVAMAEGGTLFFDEIDALSLAAQGKLLRFLQERRYRPLGANRFVDADVNVIAATNRDLEGVVRDKQFRADLFFRLNVLRVRLPALRDRRDDIALLAAHFLRECRAETQIIPHAFSEGALRSLALHSWPGNVRELANVVRRAAVTCDTSTILSQHLGLAITAGEPGPQAHFRAARAEAIADFERRFVLELLRRHSGNVTRAAREAKKDRRVFGRLMKRYGIDRSAL